MNYGSCDVWTSGFSVLRTLVYTWLLYVTETKWKKTCFPRRRGISNSPFQKFVTCYTKLVPAFTYTCGPFPPVTASLEEGHQPRPLPRAVGGWGGGAAGGPAAFHCRPNQQEERKLPWKATADRQHEASCWGDSVWWFPTKTFWRCQPLACSLSLRSPGGGICVWGRQKLAPGTAQVEPVLEQGHPAFPAPAGLPGSRQDSPGQLL